MKKSIILLSVLMFILKSSNAQTDWLLLGNGSTNPTTNFVGTTDPKDLSFRTDNTIKMQLESNGELGIGTTSPSSWLHIAPSGSTESFRSVSSSTSTADAWRMFRGTQEIGRLWFGSTANALNIYSARGPLRLSTGATTTTTTNCAEFVGGTGTDKGWLGLGDWNNFSAQTNLHVHTSASSNAGFQLTNSTTGTSSTDGFRIIDDNTGRVTLNNWEDKEIYFGTGNVGAGGSLSNRLVIMGGTNYGRVGIGTNSPGAQLHIYDHTDGPNGVDDVGLLIEQQATSAATVYGAKIDASGGTGTTGMVIAVDNTTGSNATMYGIYNRCRNTNTGPTTVQYAYNYYALNEGACKPERKYGFVAEMSGANSTHSYGGFFRSTITGSGSNNFGLYAEASGASTNNYGIDAYASGGSNFNYAVRATTPVGTCGLLGTCFSAAGYFSGDVYVTNGFYNVSDAMFKTNIQPVNNANQILSALNVKTFDFNQSQFGNINLPSGNHYGLIAQDVEVILPNLVKSIKAPEVMDSLGAIVYPEVTYKAVNYIELIPILIQAYKNQQQVIDSLISSLSVPNPAVNKQNAQRITLSNISSIILNQNDPNPFTESTRITYSIPENIKEAKIIFTTTSGAIVNTAIINERGAGQLEVYSSELNKGIYIYTLVCDGQVISSKKMVKQ